MTNRHIKISIIIILVITLIAIDTNKVYAYYSRHCVVLGGGSSGGSGGYDGGGSSCVEGRTITCNEKKTNETEETTLREDLYDTSGNYIGSAALIQKKIVLISGRFVGIDAYEEYKKTFYVSMNPTCVEGTYVTVSVPYACHVSITSNGSGYDSICYYPVTVLQCSSCTVTADDMKNICRPKADALLNNLINSVNVQPSYVGYRQDVNDINKGVSNGNPTIEVPVSSKHIDRGQSEPADYRSKTVWQTLTMQYRYNLAPAWIDPITAKVKYDKDTTGNYIAVKQIKTYPIGGGAVQVGQYFVPLNTKSSDLLRYNLVPNLRRPAMSKEMCLTLIDKYNTKSDTSEYWGDFLALKADGSSLYNVAKTAEAAKSRVIRDGGCRMGLYISFRIKQGFYNETKTTSVPGVQGYNFYYRPIDYSEPFPNGMDTNGYWYSRYDRGKNATQVINSRGEVDKNNSQDLDESFSKITYITNNYYKESTIRSYNSQRVYTSWKEMDTNGTSKFISGNYGISRNGCQSFYAVGCGPANIDWAQCKITEVCR